MSRLNGCRLEGEWRAYLDSELEPAEMLASREHLTTCAACTELLQQVGRRAQGVSALMAELERMPVLQAVPPRPSHGRRSAIAILALVAALAIAFLALPRRTAEVRSFAPPATLPALIAKTDEPQVVVPAPAARAPVRRRVPQARVDYYLGLDTEPIETGMVVRVALDNGLLADVIVDEQGRPHAVRPLSYEESRR